jgi:XTP/dITP diphosphohydrolase
VETGTSFAANALLKARAACTASGLPAIADDSGLCVEALGGDPGVYSARWAGPSKDFAAAMEKVWEAMQASGSRDRAAAFVSAVALAWPDGRKVEVEGRVDGLLVWPPRGQGGFGYDPMFLPEGCDRTFGEMSVEEKHSVSHRARAMAALRAALTEARS